MSNQQRFVDKKVVAERYSVTSRTILNWMRSGVLPYTRPTPRCVRFDLEACDRAMGRFSVSVSGGMS